MLKVKNVPDTSTVRCHADIASPGVLVRGPREAHGARLVHLRVTLIGPPLRRAQDAPPTRLIGPRVVSCERERGSRLALAAGVPGGRFFGHLVDIGVGLHRIGKGLCSLGCRVHPCCYWHRRTRKMKEVDIYYKASSDLHGPLLDELLVAALHGAVAPVKGCRVAVLIRNHLRCFPPDNIKTDLLNKGRWAYIQGGTLQSSCTSPTVPGLSPGLGGGLTSFPDVRIRALKVLLARATRARTRRARTEREA
eukprot:1194564-Prorocentrum_minimum.AAC.4